MSTLILGGSSDIGNARKVLSALSNRRPIRDEVETVFVINDHPDNALHHLCHALKLRESMPSLSIMVITEVTKSWSPVEALINAEIIEPRSIRTAALARSALERYWPKWSTHVSDEALTFEYQEFR